MFKTLQKSKWDNIKVAEVYAVLRGSGLFDIEVRHNREDVECSMILAGDGWNGNVGHCTSYPTDDQEIYKLPKSVQNLFITK